MTRLCHIAEDINDEKNEASETPDESSRQQTSDDSKKKIEVIGKVPYYKLFSFADPIDHVLMVIGTIMGVGSGVCLPLMTLIFGQLADSFGQNMGAKDFAEEVSKVSCSMP